MPSYTNESQKITAFVGTNGEIIINTQADNKTKQLGVIKVNNSLKEMAFFLLVSLAVIIFTLVFFIGLADSLIKDSDKIRKDNAIAKLSMKTEKGNLND